MVYLLKKLWMLRKVNQMIEINGVEYIIHYRWVYPWGSNTSCCGIPIISYLERIKELEE